MFCAIAIARSTIINRLSEPYFEDQRRCDDAVPVASGAPFFGEYPRRRELLTHPLGGGMGRHESARPLRRLQHHQEGGNKRYRHHKKSLKMLRL